MTSPLAGRAAPGTVLTRGLERLEDERVCWAVLGVGMAIFAALDLWLARGTTLFVDEWNLFQLSRGFAPEALLSPLNGHLVLLVRLLYAVDFALFGADFVVLRVVHVVGAALAAGLLFALLKRRIGAPAALAPCMLLLFLGSAWEVTFIVSGLAFVYSAAAGLGALLALERGDPRRDAAGCVLLTISLAGHTIGVPFVVGAAILILLRSADRRRLWVFLVPLALYAAWLVWLRAVYVPEHGELIGGLKLANVLLVPNFVANAAATLAGAVAGLNYDFSPEGGVFQEFGSSSPYGPVLAALAVGALVLRLRRGAVSPLLWASMAGLVVFWSAIGLSAAAERTPETVRYVYPAAVFAFLIAGEALRGARPTRTGLLVLFAVTALALMTNMARLREGSEFYRSFATTLRAQLTALEVAADHVPPSFEPSAGAAQFDHVRAGPYLDAVQRNGSPAYSTAELARQPADKRAAADAVLVPALGVGLAPAGAAVRRQTCRRLPPAGGAPHSLSVRPPGLVLVAPRATDVAVGRFTAPSISLGSLPAGRPTLLRLPPDRATRPWRVSVSATGQPLTVCRPGAGP